MCTPPWFHPRLVRRSRQLSGGCSEPRLRKAKLSCGQCRPGRFSALFGAPGRSGSWPGLCPAPKASRFSVGCWAGWSVWDSGWETQMVFPSPPWTISSAEDAGEWSWAGFSLLTFSSAVFSVKRKIFPPQLLLLLRFGLGPACQGPGFPQPSPLPRICSRLQTGQHC